MARFPCLPTGTCALDASQIAPAQMASQTANMYLTTLDGLPTRVTSEIGTPSGYLCVYCRSNRSTGYFDSLSHKLLKVWRGPTRLIIAGSRGPHFGPHFGDVGRRARIWHPGCLCGNRGYAATYPRSREGPPGIAHNHHVRTCGDTDQRIEPQKG